MDAASGNRNENAGFKLGLVVYAARVMGLNPSALGDIRRRLGEAQLSDGGIAHLVTYNSNGTVAARSGATGEATAIGIMAHTVNPVAL